MMVESLVGRDPDLEERLSPSEEAKEAERLIADFRARHPNLLSFRRKGLWLSWEESTDRKSLRVLRTTDGNVESIILLIDERAGGGIHYFKGSKTRVDPEVYGHTRIAADKVRQFLENLSHDLLNQPSERRKNSSKRQSHQRGNFPARAF